MVLTDFSLVDVVFCGSGGCKSKAYRMNEFESASNRTVSLSFSLVLVLYVARVAVAAALLLRTPLDIGARCSR
ncbi:hypothetical protein LR48_Vigan09g146600 [Vigna angularis]|uniref:Uncharacterized protein n=1 Tax=Phaseolus angularis TaxID=3914 RepID=A0A0L9VD03_PHAAN|nr:hypothetical protein LR48_Vigan09g146600 [Vigna angularis]